MAASRQLKAGRTPKFSGFFPQKHSIILEGFTEFTLKRFTLSWQTEGQCQNINSSAEVIIVATIHKDR